MKAKTDLLSKNLALQIDRYITTLEKYNRKLPHPRAKNNYPFLRDFIKYFIEDQNARAIEVGSLEYQKIKEVANKMFPVRTLWNLCVDGRVLAILMHGACAQVGSSVRVPGGILREFVRGEDGQQKLREDSDFAKLVKNALEKSSTNILAEVFDSHLGCAARQEEELLKGKVQSDFGLQADVSHKMQMAKATTEFVNNTFGQEKQLVVILTSFDPHTGFLYMGLETDAAFLFAQKHDGYTRDVFKQLVASSKIISTEVLAQEPLVRSVFEKYAFSLDWKEDYIKSARSFWGSIAAMRKTLLPHFHRKIAVIYPRLRSDDRLGKIELEERAILLLTNAFSGYLHNLERKSQKDVSKQEPHAHTTFYPYGVHKEEGVKVGEGGYPPYHSSIFSVFSFEEKNLPYHVQLAALLVRTNRREGRVTDRFGYFHNPIIFAQASLPIIVTEVVRDPLTSDQWQKLSATDWSDLPENWDTISDDLFFAYLHTKGIFHMGVALAVNNLRKKLAVLYEWYNPTSSRITEQYGVAFPVIVSRNRRVHLLVPFVKLGFA